MSDARAMSLDTVVALLGAKAKHWRLQTENSGDVRRYSCKVLAGGRRFSVTRATPGDAVRAAIAKIDSGNLRLAR